MNYNENHQQISQYTNQHSTGNIRQICSLRERKKVIYVVVLQALYGMLISALLWYKKFCSDLEGIRFIFNPYNPCIANRIVKKNNKQFVST